MKVVRTLKDSPHPAIISFHSFIITPSYALITMEYLPRLIPVEVRESKAKVWFESLLSGVAHLHNHGIVHNDIKPANILLSRSEQPVLVDFGFAERYELLDGAESFVEVVSSPLRKNGSPSCRRGNPAISNPASSSSTSLLSPSTKPVPFESSLAYGTPEYLSPERARGYKHDTRKSDVWSLGVTFFEVITGRTPFELDDENGKGEEFTTKEDLERYWSRTNNGIWVGKWKMSAGMHLSNCSRLFGQIHDN
jgi:serine/threonine protein kinase